jgi:flagellar basal-body rod protein FlgB
MPTISGVGNTPPSQPPADKGHGTHGGGNAAITGSNAGQSFASTLAQVVGQSPAVTPHAGHGVGNYGAGISSTNATSHSQGHGLMARASNAGSQPKHDGEHGFQELALRVRAYRQQLIASNIANADTPGYKAVDIDFSEALRIAQSARQTLPLTLATTSSGHIPGKGFASPPFPLKYHIPSQPSVDGNTVEMDVERAKFAENAMMYEFALDRVKGHYMHMTEMLKNLKD